MGELGMGRAPLAGKLAVMFDCPMRDFDPSHYGEADRCAVDPPIEVEAATWSAVGTLDWWVKERQQ
jgi:hypothetical protein